MKNQDAAAVAETRYRAWVNNKVAGLIWTIQRGGEGDERGFLRHLFFLDEIEHHFIDSHARRAVWRALDYLRRYFNAEAGSKDRHRGKALEMVSLIYEELGLEVRKVRAVGEGYKLPQIDGDEPARAGNREIRESVFKTEAAL